ncbi:hypothetical protein AB5L52_38780 [Streptomyces sp. CG4]|uniref:hypothetical protein n=1 Tax=Streptomyces sp. CG4 TaxID=408783 RepID=UPI0034E2E4AC
MPQVDGVVLGQAPGPHGGVDAVRADQYVGVGAASVGEVHGDVGVRVVVVAGDSGAELHHAL